MACDTSNRFVTTTTPYYPNATIVYTEQGGQSERVKLTLDGGIAGSNPLTINDTSTADATLATNTLTINVPLRINGTTVTVPAGSTAIGYNLVSAGGINLTQGTGGQAGSVIVSDVITATAATAIAGAITDNSFKGIVTSEALTTAPNADYTLTLTNNKVLADSVLVVNVDDGTNTQGMVTVTTVKTVVGIATIKVRNIGTQALNGTLKISYRVF